MSTIQDRPETLAAWMLRVGISSACIACDSDVHLSCTWPICACTTLPVQMRAGLAAVMSGLPSDAAIVFSDDDWMPTDMLGQEIANHEAAP